jgi:DNA-directed RNA polymerase specialized sigma24 family protein
MKTYRVDVVRDEGWWIMHARIPRTIIYSQAKRVDDVEPMIRDAIAGVLDVDLESFEIELIFDFDADVLDQVNRAREASTEAAEVQERASRESRAAVHALRKEGLTLKEAGYFLGVTPQRVAQLLNS